MVANAGFNCSFPSFLDYGFWSSIKRIGDLIYTHGHPL